MPTPVVVCAPERTTHMAEIRRRGNEHERREEAKRLRFTEEQEKLRKMGLMIGSKCILYREQSRNYHLLEILDLPTDPKRLNWRLVQFKVLGSTQTWNSRYSIYLQDAQLIKWIFPPEHPRYADMLARITKKTAELSEKNALFFRNR